MKKAPSPYPLRKNFDWWGGCAAGVPFAGKRKRAFFRNFPSAVRFVQRCPTRNRLSDFYLPEARKAPEYPRGFSCVLRMSGKRFLKGFILRGGPATVDGPSLEREKAEGGHCGISPASPLLRVPFICQGGAAGRPLVFEEGWSSGRGGERPSSEGSPSPIPYPFPCPTRRIRLP